MKEVLKKLFYSIAGLKPLNQLGRPWRGRAIVLCYHRVLPDTVLHAKNGPNSGLAISETLFTEHMAYLVKNQTVVSIDELVAHIEGPSNKFVVAITFDDGYKDNLTHALSILEYHGIPATIYITTRFPEGSTWMWWYELWDHLMEVDHLEVSFQSQNRQWKTKLHQDKIRSFRQLEAWIMNLHYEKQIYLAEAITKTSHRKQYPELCLNWDEIKALDRHELVTIGAHTHTHPNLRTLDDKEAFFEMSHSKNLLKQYLGHSIEHFAYPFGTANEADTREFKMADRCGFRSAMTTRIDTIRSPSLNAIPRLGVEPFLSAHDLCGKISGWEHLARKASRNFDSQRPSLLSV